MPQIMKADNSADHQDFFSEHQNIFQTIFEQSPIGKELYDKQGRLQHANEACLKIFGIESINEVVGFNLFEDPNIPLPMMERMRQGEIIKYNSEFNFDLVKKLKLYNTSRSGKIVLDIFITPLTDTNGERSGYLVQVQDITEFKNRSNALTKKTEELDRYFTKSLDLICIANVEGYFLRLNPAWTEVLGHSVEELVGRKFFDFIHPDDLPSTIEAISTLKSQKSIPHFTNRYLAKDGKYRWIEWRSFLEGDLIYAVARDVTENKLMEMALNARIALSEYAQTHSLSALLQETLDITEELTNSQIGFAHFVDDDQQNLTLQAWSTKTMTKFCKAEGRGQHYSIAAAGVWVDCIKERRPVVHNDYATLTNKKGLPSGHAPIIRELVVPILRNEKIVAVFGVGNKACNYTGEDIKATKYMADTAWAIIEQKMAEERLQESEERWKFALDGSGDGVWDWNAVTNKVYFSPQWKKMLGYDDTDIGNDLSEWDTRVHPEDRSSVFADLKLHLDGKTPFYLNEHRMRCKDGTYKWILDRGKVVNKNSAGAVVRVIGTHTDISARKKFEEEQRKTQEQLFHSSKLASIGTLAAGVAHEINNPLAILKGNIVILKDDYLSKCVPGDDTSHVEKILDRQDRAIDRIANIVSGLRTYARNDTDLVEIISLNKIIGEVLGLCENIYNKSNIVVKTFFHSEENLVKLNHGKFQQVLMNLLNNARDAIVEKKIDGQITIDVSTVSEKIILKIADNGTGIDRQYLSKMFDPFWTTKPVGQGTGLGLSISQAIIHSFQGKINFESTRDVGTTATIELPLYREERESTILVTGKTSTPSSFPRPTELLAKIKGRVLIVDDEEFLRDLLHHFLEFFGLEVDAAKDGVEGLEKARMGIYDFIITDMKMPRMSGDKLIEEVCKLKTVRPKILVITGGISSDFSNEQLNSLRKNADGIITKPFTKQQLYEALTDPKFDIKAL